MTMSTTTGTGAIGSSGAMRPLTGFAFPSYLDGGAASRRAVVAHEPSCTCGQALEFSRTAHCPRCGITLPQ